jgi:hypothetical protein
MESRTLWLVLLARFDYRRRHDLPTLPLGISAFSRRFSSPLHVTLYGLMHGIVLPTNIKMDGYHEQRPKI